MSNQITFFNYDTLPEKLYDKYVPICDSNIRLPYKSGSRIFSHPPKPVVLIQMVAVAAFTALAVSLFPVPALSIALTVAAVGFIGYRTYTVFFCKDPLMDVFHKITTAGNNPVPFLAVYVFTPNRRENSVQERVRLFEDGNSLSFPIYEGRFIAATASDSTFFGEGGRTLKVKGPANKLFVFVENFSPFGLKNMSLLEKMTAIFRQLLSLKNQFDPVLLDNGNTELLGSISTDMANEFFLQNKYRQIVQEGKELTP